MNVMELVDGAVAALSSAAGLGALTAPACAASGTSELNGEGVEARGERRGGLRQGRGRTAVEDARRLTVALDRSGQHGALGGVLDQHHPHALHEGARRAGRTGESGVGGVGSVHGP